MDALVARFASMQINDNFEYIGKSDYSPRPPRANLDAIEQHKKAVLKGMDKYLYTYEIEEIIAGRKRSDITHEESVLADFFEGNVARKDIIKDDIYYRSLKHVTTLFAPPKKCRPVHIFDVQFHYPHKRASNAEAPFSTEKFFIDEWRSTHPEMFIHGDPKKSFGNMEHVIFPWTRRFLHEIKDGAPYDKFLWQIQLHNKTALIEKHEDNKLRSISGFPRPQNIAWIMFTWSYIKFLKERDPRESPLLWGYETILGGWFRLNYELFTGYIQCTILTLDKSRFDKYYYFAIQDDIDTMIESFIEFDSGYMPTTNYPDTKTDWTPDKGNRLRRLFKWLTYSFRHCPTVIYDGSMFKRKYAGMPSGVYTVQLFDTIYFAITDTDVLTRMGHPPPAIRLRKGQGDDIITQLYTCVSPSEHDSFLETYSRIDHDRFGSIVKPEKSEARNSPRGATVLGYTNNNGVPVRSTIDLMAQLYHTKQVDPTPAKTMATAVGIAYASMGHDKRVFNVCKEIYDYYASLGFTPNETVARQVFYTDEYTPSVLETTEFPTLDDIRRHILDFIPKGIKEKAWPRSHFLEDF